MASPFPGIDPYLEGSRWPSVQTQLSVEIARGLAPVLRPRYVVRTPQRRYDRRNAPSSLWMLMDRHLPGVTIEIRLPHDGTLITVIDVLLASDKDEQGHGRSAYLARRAQILGGSTNLIEIDLLRSGARMPLPEPVLRDPYTVLVSRAADRSRGEIWPFKLTDPIPTVPVPLGKHDQDVPLDLNRAFTTTHSLFGYDLDAHYERGPEVPLEPKQLNWAQRMVQMWEHEGK